MKHAKYDTIAVNPDFIVKPVDGFGTKDMIRQLLITEQPDAIFLFTDPRQFIWVWEMEDEIRQVCPIVYWHVWDNDPYPAFNRPWYESTDLINCLSYKTYELIKPNFPEKTNYIPHTFPKQVYYPLPEDKIAELKKQNFGARADWFKAIWVNRNATRKMPNDVLFAWKTFLDDLEKKHGHRNAVLMMHTDPTDVEGPNLLAASDMLGLHDHVWFSNERLQFEQMNILHNLSDVCINVSKNEGFGLSTLISMQVGRPMIALKTGGETRQVEDYRNGYQYGVGIEPAKRSLVGSQMVPYIFEDFCTERQVSDAFMEIYEWSDEKKAEFREKAAEYLEHEFKYENMVQQWHESMLKCVEDFKAKKESNTLKRWRLESIVPAPRNKLVNIK